MDPQQLQMLQALAKSGQLEQRAPAAAISPDQARMIQQQMMGEPMQMHAPTAAQIEAAKGMMSRPSQAEIGQMLQHLGPAPYSAPASPYDQLAKPLQVPW